MSNRILFLILFFAFVLTTGTALSSQPFAVETLPIINEISNPGPFNWTYVSSPEPHYVGVMEYGEATFTINGQSLTTRAYRQEGGTYSIPGPTLHMTPGNRYVLRFRNLLPYEAPNPAHNILKDPNITNVHTHGLHISGDSPGDDVFRMFEGGYGGDYVYDIPADHMGGTYWYHAHHHGSTFLQVSTGGFGLIIIDDSGDGIPANVAAMEERQVIIGYLDPSAKGAGGDTIVGGTFQKSWTVNGLVNGILVIPPYTWQHWRVLLADRNAEAKDLVFGSNCEVKLLARDGVWRTSVPKDILANTLNLSGASRADFALRCTANSSISVESTAVANILVSGTPDPGPHPYAPDGVSQWSALRPDYLRDLRSETTYNTETIHVTGGDINGVPFDQTTPLFTLNANAVQQWTINGANNHPFHLHIYHFQAQVACGGDYEEGEYYDTITENCVVRFDLNTTTSSPYSGKTIFHCHILRHEDQGAMGWMEVVGGTPAPAFPSGTGYSAYYTLAVAPIVTISDGGGTRSQLDWMPDFANCSYNIYRSTSPNAIFGFVTALPAGTSTYLDIAGTIGNPANNYFYYVEAVNCTGDSTASSHIVGEFDLTLVPGT